MAPESPAGIPKTAAREPLLLKVAAAVLAVPILAVIYVTTALRRSTLVRNGSALALGGILAVGVVLAGWPSPAAATPPSAVLPVTDAAFGPVVATGTGLDRSADRHVLDRDGPDLGRRPHLGGPNVGCRSQLERGPHTAHDRPTRRMGGRNVPHHHGRGGRPRTKWSATAQPGPHRLPDARCRDGIDRRDRDGRRSGQGLDRVRHRVRSTRRPGRRRRGDHRRARLRRRSRRAGRCRRHGDRDRHAAGRPALPLHPDRRAQGGRSLPAGDPRPHRHGRRRHPRHLTARPDHRGRRRRALPSA